MKRKHVQLSVGLLKMRASKLLFLYASRNDLRKHAQKMKQKFNMLILLPASSPVRKG